jgi:mono/diheme cytochrome c family protein
MAGQTRKGGAGGRGTVLVDTGENHTGSTGSHEFFLLFVTEADQVHEAGLQAFAHAACIASAKLETPTCSDRGGVVRESLRSEYLLIGCLLCRTVPLVVGHLLFVVLLAGGGQAAKPAAVPTFDKEVAPILYKNCTNCHRPGEIAPMSLLSYKEARPWAKSIKEKVATGVMPPWHADPHYGSFENDRRLSQKDIDTIVAWVDQGAKEGNPKDQPPTPQFADGWNIGKPDVVFYMPQEFTVPASGVVEYKYFKVPTNFKQDMYLQAIEIRPGERGVVHHIIVFAQSAKDPQRLIAGYAPGEQPAVIGKGLARRIPAGSAALFRQSKISRFRQSARR